MSAQDIRLRHSLITHLSLSRLAVSRSLSRCLSRSLVPAFPSSLVMSDSSSSDSSSDTRLPIKLEGPTNYNTWCRYVKGALKVKCLVAHITAVAPTDANKLEEWNRNDQRAQGIITLSVSATMLTVLGDADLTAKQMWDKLAKHCRRQDMWRLVDLLRQLTNTRLLDAAGAEQHLATMSDIRTQFVNYGKPIPEWIAAFLLLLSVPTDDPRWEVFLGSHTAAATAAAAASSSQDADLSISWDSVSAAIMAEASKQSQQDAERARKQQADNAIATAYAARMQANKRPAGQGDSKQPRYCTHCQKKGHVVETCWELHPEQRPPQPSVSGTKRANLATVSTSSGTALAVTEHSAGLWYVDSGASFSLTGDKSWFTELRECVPCTVSAANDGVLRCSQRGTVVLNVRYGSITVKDVLFVPSLTVNLLSVSALLKCGYRPHFTPTGCAIIKRGGLLAEIKAHDNVYPLVASRQAAKVLSAVSSSTSKALDWATVHARLGHLNAQAIQLMHDKQMALGVAMPARGSPDDIKQCVGCAVGKAHRLPFPAQASHRATRPLELIHSDMCGPIDIRHDLPGNKQVIVKWYILTFVDDYSRWVWIAFTSNKSGPTVMDQFKRYRAHVQLYTGFDIKAIRTDGGSEYINADFKTYLHILGVDRQVTAAYTPQQNGVAERVNRTILEAARAMLHAADLPLSFWIYAVQAAVYIRNRSPTRALNNITPYEAWRGEKPNLSHLRVFGCRAFMYLHKQQRSSTSKLAARAMPGIFVGYSNEAKAWLVWDPISKKVHTSRDVKFIESVPGSAPLTQSVKAAEPTGSIDSDSGSTKAAEPVDTERSTILDALITVDEESDSDSDGEAEAAPPAEAVMAAEPVVAEPHLAVSQAVGSTSAQSSASQPSIASQRRRQSKSERALRQLASFNTPGNSEPSDEQHQAMFALAAHVSTSISEPHSYKEAAQSPHRAQWEQAMQDELDSIKANDTYALVPLPAGRQAIGCKWVFKIKRHADGSIDRYKARLVAKGYSQLYGIDFTETFAPVVRFSSLRAILAIAASADYDIHQMDVKTAFLNGDLDEDIYMQQPDGYRAGGAQVDHVWKLNKSLYGLKQAGRAWNKKMDAALVELAFKPLQSDSCVYVHRDGNAAMFLLLYVDDLLLVTNDTTLLSSTKKALSARFDMKDMGEAHFILGVQIRRDRAKRQLYLSQAEYIRTILERFGMQDCKPAASPMVTGAKLLRSDSGAEVSSESMANIPYASAVGALMYAALATRPDISYAVTTLCQFMSAPDISHWLAAKRVFRYLQGTRHHELVYGWSGSSHRPLYGYSDSDWGNDVNDRRSVTGWVFLLHDGAVSWQSCKQSTVALSSVEAEYMAAAAATREAVWWRAFLAELGLPPLAPTTVHSDSQGAIGLAKNPEHHKRSKHIDIKHHYVREQVAAGSVVVPYISTNDMVADVLTKPLAADRHNYLAGEMGVKAGHSAA